MTVGCRIPQMRSSSLIHICPVLLILLLPGGTAARTEDNTGGLLERCNAILSGELGIGWSDNAYLTSGNRTEDIFAHLTAEIECRRQIGDSCSLYLSTYVMDRSYLSETDASEQTVDLFAEYSCSGQSWRAGVAGNAIYEDYRTFEAESLTLPTGDYESFTPGLRIFGRLYPTVNSDIEIGISCKARDYTTVDYDYAEYTIDSSCSRRIFEVIEPTLFLRYRMQDYDMLKALSEDGTASDLSPFLELAVARVGASVDCRFSRANTVEVSGAYSTAEDAFEGESSYEEFGLGLSSVLQFGADYAVAADLNIDRRTYEKRVIPESDVVQEDDFLTLAIMAERRIRGTLSAYCSTAFKKRNSNDNSQDYAELSFTVGLKHVL